MIAILVVDDEKDVEPLFRQKFRKEIRAGKVRVDFAFSAEDALARLRETDGRDYVLILSDINMPGMSGLDLLNEIKTTYGQLPVVMVTAYGDERNHQMAIERGADGFLTKPVDFTELKKTVFA